MIADHLGWSVVTGSGSRSTHPGDVESDEWLEEPESDEKDEDYNDYTPDFSKEAKAISKGETHL